MKQLWAKIAYLAGLALIGLGSTAAHAFKINSTTGSELCIKDLNEKDQEAIFSRIVNIGASYSKGCFTCDFNSDTRKHLKEIGEFGWVNRHYLIKFLKRTDWENLYSRKKVPYSFTFSNRQVVGQCSWNIHSLSVRLYIF